MHDMADYEYYVNCYLGNLIPEQAFSALAMRAKAYLDKLSRTFLVSGGEDERAMAVCAMAEELYRNDSRKGVASASIGGVRVQYRENAQTQESSRLYRAAAIYLDIYRGKELCKANGVSSV